MKRVIVFLLSTSWVCASSSASALELGSFKATKVCPLLQSKKKGTNPGKLKTTVNVIYQAFEANPSEEAPTWFRVRIPNGNDLRWVESNCGTFSQASEPEPIEPPDDTSELDNIPGESTCHSANTYDSHVLAISWQAGFCHFKSAKPECKSLPQETYATSHFTLHGLWPNKKECGVNYDFCGAVTEEKKNFCAFPKIELDKSIDAALGQVMPAEKYGSCLERHEWWKHGTCRDTAANSYYSLAISLLKGINESAFVSRFMASQIGALVSRERFVAELNKSFGQDAHRHVKLQCNSGILTEMQVALPKELDQNKDIKAQIAQGPTMKGGSCPDRFWILDAG